MKIILIRHGKTSGNEKKRYIGITDEPVTSEGLNEIVVNRNIYYQFGMPKKLFTSPLIRCINTVQTIYPNMPYTILDDLRECDFGEFEGKNYRELSSNRKYQEWIKSNAKEPFPGGEDIAHMKQRSKNALFEIIKSADYDSIIAVITHGGIIMSIMDDLFTNGNQFYQWHVENGNGYILEITSDKDINHPHFILDGKMLWKRIM